MREDINDTFIEMINTRIIINEMTGNEKPKLISCDEFELKVHEGMPYLLLKDIAEQLNKKFDDLLLIDVWVEQGLSGYIYRYGNYGEYWVEHGKTKGFA